MTGLATPLWLADCPLVLASKSAGRRTVLQSAGLPLETVPAVIDERAVESASGLTEAGLVASLLAAAKARSISARMPGRLVLGADQTLACGTARFSKPADRAGAAAQLKALSGKTHTLHSAIVLVRDDATLFSHRETARLAMRPLSDAMIDRYLDAAGDAALASVGAYQVEGPGIHLFDAVEGDHFTILGLPLLPLLAFLRHEKWIAA